MNKQIQKSFGKQKVIDEVVQVALNTRQKLAVPLIEKVVLSSDSRRFRFALPTKKHKLGLPIGKHFFVSGRWNGEFVMRPYTPVTGDEVSGYVDLVIKVGFTLFKTRWVSMDGSVCWGVMSPSATAWRIQALNVRAIRALPVCVCVCVCGGQKVLGCLEGSAIPPLEPCSASYRSRGLQHKSTWIQYIAFRGLQ